MATDTPKRDQVTPAVPDKTPVEARQGVISGRVITVLLVSVFLAILAIFLAWLLFR